MSWLVNDGILVNSCTLHSLSHLSFKFLFKLFG